MIISTNRFDKSNSKYECDMCKNKISAVERMAISVAQSYGNSKKKWDLCPRCYRKVEKAIENYSEKKGEKNDT